MSAALYRVDHTTPFSRLKYLFDLSGKVLEWLQSFFNNARNEYLFMTFCLMFSN